MADDFIPGRRTFLKTAGLAGASSSLVGCGQHPDILPLLRPDAREILGRPQYFATVCRECPAGCGMVVRVNDGRPTKCEGNPSHPVNAGKLCIRGQSAVQGLYNPNRFPGPMLRNARGQLQPVDWTTALARWQAELTAVSATSGQVAWLGRLENGALADLIAAFQSAFGFAPPLYYEHFSYLALRQAEQLVHDRFQVPTYRFGPARSIVSFGAEFLETWVSNVEFAHDFAQAHSFGQNPDPAHFLFAGPRLSLTGANADQYWPARPGTEHLLAWALLRQVASRGNIPLRVPAAVVPPPAQSLEQIAAATGIAADLIQTAAQRLLDVRPSLLLGTGYVNDHRGSVSCHVAVALLNQLLGNDGVTVLHDTPHALTRVATPNQTDTLFDRAQRGQVRILHLHHANPIYHQPAWTQGLQAIPFKVSFAPWMDETTQHADLILPDHHFLESWGDYSPRASLAGTLQPTRLPLHDTRPTGDLLLTLADRLGRRLSPAADFHQYLRARWSKDEATWNHQLMVGVSTAPPPLLAPTAPPPPPATIATAPAGFDGDGDLYLALFPSVQFFDGRQADRSWCQEIAEPLSKVAWDGWAELNPATAKARGLGPGDVVRLHTASGSAEFPLFITTWIRPDTIGVLLGQGHTNFGMFANECGDNPARLLPRPGADTGALTVMVRLEKTGRQRNLINLQAQRLQTDKKIALAVGLNIAPTDQAREMVPNLSFYENHPHPLHRWGMAIDLDSCIGCNACQAACYAENNIAIWGRAAAANHREMTWIRVELWEGERESPSTLLHPDLRFLPMPCQQCGNAPCEYVCPVFAAYHTDEGLNAQIYNRCVGTRYCSNNCIYKVRRFNWFTPQWPEPLNQQLNPDVTVRAKGVMEKCTFCVQRIEAAEIDARGRDTVPRDGDIQTACMQTCPTNAIIFGDLRDTSSRVFQAASQPRAYALFADQNTFPAVRYLKKVHREPAGAPARAKD